MCSAYCLLWLEYLESPGSPNVTQYTREQEKTVTRSSIARFSRGSHALFATRLDIGPHPVLIFW